jgi:hypothetical protein
MDQYVHHHKGDESDDDSNDELLEALMPKVGWTVLYFNKLESTLDSALCSIISDRTDGPGMIVLHGMSFGAKVDLLQRFHDDLHKMYGLHEINGYRAALTGMREAASLRNIVVHTQWETIDLEGRAYVRMRLSHGSMEQEYVQFDPDKMDRITDRIIVAQVLLDNYLEQLEDAISSSSTGL